MPNWYDKFHANPLDENLKTPSALHTILHSIVFQSRSGALKPYWLLLLANVMYNLRQIGTPFLKQLIPLPKKTFWRRAPPQLQHLKLIMVHFCTRINFCTFIEENSRTVLKPRHWLLYVHCYLMTMEKRILLGQKTKIFRSHIMDVH